ncbi:predicted protein [Uncinocarpus reesii 1704]|uniref:CBM-cenC domain-containing protein n=1 Tax=Uncinocarpus reesii (strain UAMH 1704) TaxID=336963 RepID=C4JS87_UNCRE|nr:uncharacterized protein UREG_05326 [Uncinocarpus reesii 1704]EEP80484.1 predicted protein [Uncinocarpus reesii 1704]
MVRISILLTFAAAAAALPNAEPAALTKRGKNHCKPHSVDVSNPEGTEFCRHLLHLPCRTSTRTVTPPCKTVSVTMVPTVTRWTTSSIVRQITRTITRGVTLTHPAPSATTVTQTLPATEIISEYLSATVTETATNTIALTATESVDVTVTETEPQSLFETEYNTITSDDWVTLTESITQTSTATVLDPTTVTVPVTVTVRAPAKRHHRPQTPYPTPTSLKNIPKHVLSKACSSLHLGPCTTTATRTRTLPQITKTEIIHKPGETSTRYRTAYVYRKQTTYVTKFITAITTAQPTGPLTETVSITVTATSIETLPALSTATLTETVDVTSAATVTATATEIITVTQPTTIQITIATTVHIPQTEMVTETIDATATETVETTLTATATATYTQPPRCPNLIKNGDFAVPNLNNWAIDEIGGKVSMAGVGGGGYAALLYGSGSNLASVSMSQIVSTVPGTIYKFSVDHKNQYKKPGSYLTCTFLPATQVFSFNLDTTVTGSWTHFESPVLATSTSLQVRCRLVTNNAAMINLDNFKLRACDE